MARESFACDDVAAILNNSFIPIKLDREERPDIDDVYMNYVEATNGTGGWPLNVFLTPDLEPVFGGTYWPSTDSASNLRTVTPLGEEVPMVTFIEILEKLKDLWETQQWRCRESARGITQQLKEFAEEGTHSTAMKDEKEGNVLDQTEVTTNDLEVDLLEEAYQNFSARFDTKHGGFGLEPKFPMPANLSFLLRLARYPPTTPVADVVGYEECHHATDMVVQTLIAMARGGIHDHLGHGFARYSITADWGLPHFEKMLSDQAQLLDVYLDAYEVTRRPELLNAVNDLISYLTKPPIWSRETGAFYCSEDADSLPARPDSSSSSLSSNDDPVNHKYEGAYYTWTLREFVNLLGARDAEICARYWGVEADGNIPRDHDPADEFLNQNVLNVRFTPKQLAKDFGLSEDEVVKIIKNARRVLDTHRRTRRVPPDVDDKIVAGWNGLAIHALAKASIIISEVDEERAIKCLHVAERCMRFVRREMVDGQSGQIWRVWRRQSRANTPGFADDYAYLCHASISLYYATFDDQYLQFAELLQTYLNGHFLSYEDPINSAKSTGYYMTPSPFPSGVPPPLLRLKQGTDSAHPAANGVIVKNLLHLSSLLNDETYARLAEETVAAFAAEILQHPFLFVGLLDGVVGLEAGVKGVVGVVRGNRDEDGKVIERVKPKAEDDDLERSNLRVMTTTTSTKTEGNPPVADPSLKESRQDHRQSANFMSVSGPDGKQPAVAATATPAESARLAVIRAARKAAGLAITTSTATNALLDFTRPENSSWLRQRNTNLRDLLVSSVTDIHDRVFVCEAGVCRAIGDEVDTTVTQMGHLHLEQKI
ncbi:hypothetical protein KEM54_004138 [Ascosphaera aggregata]|nr:hypothetical protein KEM54_004138 [Ascosphaera aggregata]